MRRMLAGQRRAAAGGAADAFEIAAPDAAGEAGVDHLDGPGGAGEGAGAAAHAGRGVIVEGQGDLAQDAATGGADGVGADGGAGADADVAQDALVRVLAFGEARAADAVLERQLLDLRGLRATGEQEVQDAGAQAPDAGGIGVDAEAVAGGEETGRDHARCVAAWTIDLDQAQPATAPGLEAFVVAKRGNVDPGAASHVEEAVAGLGMQVASVDDDDHPWLL